MSDSFEDARKLAITGGAIIMFLLLIGLSKTGVNTETLFYFLPIIWLIGIILCGLLMRMCTLFDKFAAPPSASSSPTSNSWDADLVTAEFNPFGVPRGNSLLPLPAMRNTLLSRVPSLPKYEEVMQSAAPIRIDIEPESSSMNDNEHLLPPSYEEAVARYSTAEQQQSAPSKD